ncbi:MAG: PAS domain S-box protein [Rhodospirillales bacterium]|nr:PAS domain S-box protein [Acetobacter sp.]
MRATWQGTLLVRDQSEPPPSTRRSNATAQQIALFKATIEAAGEAVVITSADLDRPGPTIEYVNPAFTAMTGYTADEVIGKSPRLLQGLRTDRKVLGQLRSDLRTHGEFRGEAINYRKDGREYIVEWLVTAVRDESGRVLHWVAIQRDVTDHRQMEARQTLLLAELQHRTRNLLAVVQSIASQTMASASEVEVFEAKFSQRLAALSRVQGLLSRADPEPITIGVLLRMELDALEGDRESTRVCLSGPEVCVHDSVVQTLALALHELATNARKHGALTGEVGQITVTWRVQDEDGEARRLVLEWIEDTGSQPVQTPDPARIGYGRQLIEHALPYSLGARTEYSLRDHGVRCVIDLPLDLLEQRRGAK